MVDYGARELLESGYQSDNDPFVALFRACTIDGNYEDDFYDKVDLLKTDFYHVSLWAGSSMDYGENNVSHETQFFVPPVQHPKDFCKSVNPLTFKFLSDFVTTDMFVGEGLIAPLIIRVSLFFNT